MHMRTNDHHRMVTETSKKTTFEPVFSLITTMYVKYVHVVHIMLSL